MAEPLADFRLSDRVGYADNLLVSSRVLGTLTQVRPTRWPILRSLGVANITHTREFEA